MAADAANTARDRTVETGELQADNVITGDVLLLAHPQVYYYVRRELRGTSMTSTPWDGPGDPTDIGLPPDPPQIPTKVKAWVGFGGTLVTANAALLTATLADGVITMQEWVALGIAIVGSALTGLGVYAAPRYKHT